MKIKAVLILIISMVFGSLIAAELPSHPLTFQNWKRVQIHESTNEVIKYSKEISDLKAAQLSSDNSSEEKQKKILNELTKKQAEQKTKLENLQYSKHLNFEDYFDVYLSKFSGNKKAIDYIAKRLSKSSVAYLLERSIKKTEQPKSIIGSKINQETTSKN